MLGLCCGGRVAIGTMYMTEFVPERNQQVVVTALNCGDATTMIMQAIYYKYNDNWLPLHIFGLIWCFLNLIAVWVIPESPKFFYANKRFQEAKKSLQTVLKFNKPDMDPSILEALVFDTEYAIT